jgi:hypothetical protein
MTRIAEDAMPASEAARNPEVVRAYHAAIEHGAALCGLLGRPQ